MNRKKVITIIVTLFLLLLVILGIMWYQSRKKAQETGRTPQTFANFFGLSSKNTTGTDGNDSTLTSDFTNNTSGNGTGSSTGTNTGTPGQNSDDSDVRSSEFTSGPFTPLSGGSGLGNASGSGRSGGSNGSLPPGGGGGGAGGSGGGSGNGATTTIPPNAVVPDCNDADLNITFTADERARLQALQDRFYEIAQTLYTDENVATELANHDSFKLKNQQITELLDFCKPYAKKVADRDPIYQSKVPTPFWFEQSDIRQNNQGPNIPIGYFSTPGPVGGKITQTITSEAKGNTLRTLENILRLNLW